MEDYTNLVMAIAAAVPVVFTTVLALRDGQRKKIEAERAKLNKQSALAVEHLVAEVDKLRERVLELEKEVMTSERYSRQILNALAKKGLLDEILKEVS